mgnify:CR=1 FL=1
MTRDEIEALVREWLAQTDSLMHWDDQAALDALVDVLHTAWELEWAKRDQEMFLDLKARLAAIQEALHSTAAIMFGDEPCWATGCVPTLDTAGRINHKGECVNLRAALAADARREP